MENHENILEARIEFKENKLTRVTVLVDFTPGSLDPGSDVRAIFASNKPMGGYMFLSEKLEVSLTLLQRVAKYGCETVDRDKIFPGWEKKFINP